MSSPCDSPDTADEGDAPFARFEIFRRAASGGVEWVETVESLEVARERIRILTANGRLGHYFVFDRENAQFIDAENL